MNATIVAALSKESAERGHSPEVSCKYRGRGMPQVSMRYKNTGRMRQFRPDYRLHGSYFRLDDNTRTNVEAGHITASHRGLPSSPRMIAALANLAGVLESHTSGVPSDL
jgi:hypothetical protein